MGNGFPGEKSDFSKYCAVGNGRRFEEKVNEEVAGGGSVG